MAPTLPSWQKDVAVFRHGEPHCTEMLCQCAEKAPKWSFAGGKGHRVHDELAYNPDFSVITHDTSPKRYTKDPTFSFGHSRSASTPNMRSTGPDYCPRTSSTTPLYSFGSTKRPSPFPGQEGPGPELQHPALKGGPRYSMRSRGSGKRTSGGPGPEYVPRDLTHAPAPRWGRDRCSSNYGTRTRSASIGGPGPYYFRDTMLHDGPAYSMCDDRRKAKQEIDKRQLGNPWTYFGYDDFGHTEHADIRRRDKLPLVK